MGDSAGSHTHRTARAGSAHRNHVRARTRSPTRARRHQQHRYADGAAIEVLAPMLAWTIYISFIGALVLLLPKIGVQAARISALLAAVAGLALTIVQLLHPITGEMTKIVRVPWV